MILPPFEMALRAGVRSVMNSYTDIDGVPAAADPACSPTCCATPSGSPAPWSPTTSPSPSSDAARRGGEPGGGRAPRPHRRHRRRAALREHLRRAAARRRRRPARSTRRSSTGRCAGPQPEMRARPARRRLGAGRADRRRPRRRRVARGRPRAGPTLGGAARQRRHPAAARRRPRRRGRAPRRHARGDAGLLLLPACTSCCTIPGSSSASTSPRCARPSRTTFDVTYALGCPVLGGDDEDIAAAVARGGPGRRLRRRARRPGRPVRQRHLGRGLRRHRPSACPGGRRSCWTRCSRPAPPSSPCCSSAALRPEPPGRPAGRAGLRLLPREEGGRGDRRRAERPGQPSGRLPVGFPGAGSSQPSTYLAAAAGPAQRGDAPSTRRRCSLRARPVLRRRHVGSGLRRRPDRGTPTARSSSRSDWPTRPTGAVVGGRPGLPARPGRLGRPAGPAADRWRPASTSSPASGRVRFDAARRPDLVHRPRPAPHRRAGCGGAAGRRVQRGHPRSRAARARGPGPPGRRGPRAGAR